MEKIREREGINEGQRLFTAKKYVREVYRGNRREKGLIPNRDEKE